MGYTINYGQATKHKTTIKRFDKRRSKYIVYALLAAGVCIAAVCVGKMDWCRELLIPGDSKVTSAAFSGFISDVQSGSSVREAFSDFCREIVVGAQLT